MAAGVLDLTIEQGVDFGMAMTIKDANDTPINITGYTFRGKIKESAQDSSPVEEFTFALTDPGNGVVTVSLTAAETAAITATGDVYDEYTPYVYDIEMVDLSSKVTRLLNGEVTVSPEVTD